MTMKNFLQRRPQPRTIVTTQTLLSLILLLMTLHQETPATEISWILCSFNQHGYRVSNNI